MKPIPMLSAPRGGWPSAARTAAAVIATAGLVLLAAACSGSPSSTGSGGSSAGGSASSRLVAYSQCMRSHGVPNWPDPTIDTEGRPLFNITVPRPPPPRIGAAINECGRLVPAGSLLAWG